MRVHWSMLIGLISSAINVYTRTHVTIIVVTRKERLNCNSNLTRVCAIILIKRLGDEDENKGAAMQQIEDAIGCKSGAGEFRRCVMRGNSHIAVTLLSVALHYVMYRESEASLRHRKKLLRPSLSRSHQKSYFGEIVCVRALPRDVCTRGRTRRSLRIYKCRSPLRVRALCPNLEDKFTHFTS